MMTPEGKSLQDATTEVIHAIEAEIKERTIEPSEIPKALDLGDAAWQMTRRLLDVESGLGADADAIITALNQ